MLVLDLFCKVTLGFPRTQAATGSDGFRGLFKGPYGVLRRVDDDCVLLSPTVSQTKGRLAVFSDLQGHPESKPPVLPTMPTCGPAMAPLCDSGSRPTARWKCFTIALSPAPERYLGT